MSASRVSKAVPIAKLDEDRRIAFGWANVAVSKAGETIVDWEDDQVDIANLEDRAYEFVRFYGDFDDHHTEPVVAKLVESFVVTPDKLAKMGLAGDALPLGWWVGFRVEDDTIWRGVKNGQYKMLSIGGEGTREAVIDAE